MNDLAYAHVLGQERLRDGATAAGQLAWQQNASYDREDVPRFLQLMLPLLLGAQNAVVQLLLAYFAQSLGRPLPAIDTAAVIDGIRGEVGPAEVYERPFIKVWTDLGDGKQWEQAVDDGLAQLLSTIETDLQLTLTHTTAMVTEETPDIVGFARVPNPGACDLCLLASTQRYHRGDLMPIHNRCRCGVAPLIGTEDPGQVLDHDLLGELRDSGSVAARTAQRQRARLRDLESQGTTFAVETHGELGPVLVQPGHRFTHV